MARTHRHAPARRRKGGNVPEGRRGPVHPPSGVTFGAVGPLEQTLPHFLGIGALKAATTYLDALFRQHPDLCLPSALKEVQFFNRYFDRGVDWYAGLFLACEGRRRGEISPQYLFDPASPGRIAGLLPDVRLVVSLRDPVQRAYSQYKHWVEERGYRKPFEDFLQEHPHTVERGEYFRLTSRYLALFPREQLHFVVAEDLLADPRPVLDDVFRFLDVDPGKARPIAEPPQNVSAVPRFHRAYVGTKRVTRLLYRVGGARVVGTAKRLGAERLFRGTDGKATGFQPLHSSTAASLVDHYSADVADLSRLLRRDMARFWWGNGHAQPPEDLT
jgi:hypothetical protein